MKKERGCTCVFLKHLATGNNLTTIKFCDSHRPMRSLTGRDLKNSGN